MEMGDGCMPTLCVVSIHSSTRLQPPESKGPAGLSSTYIFNGLEDGGGHHGSATLILQPVLQYGKSGCLVNPALWHSWHLGAYLVDGSGRAHCGPHIAVSTGQTVVGTATSTSFGTISEGVWALYHPAHAVDCALLGESFFFSLFLAMLIGC